MQALSLNNAGEERSKEFFEFANWYGIQTEFPAPYANQSNGSSKLLIQELWNVARTMPLDTKVLEKLLEERNLALKLALKQIAFTKNQHKYSVYNMVQCGTWFIIFVSIWHQRLRFSILIRNYPRKEVFSDDPFWNIRWHGEPHHIVSTFISHCEVSKFVDKTNSQPWRKIRLYHRCTHWHQASLNI